MWCIENIVIKWVHSSVDMSDHQGPFFQIGRLQAFTWFAIPDSTIPVSVKHWHLSKHNSHLTSRCVDNYKYRYDHSDHFWRQPGPHSFRSVCSNLSWDTVKTAYSTNILCLSESTNSFVASYCIFFFLYCFDFISADTIRELLPFNS